MKRKLSIIIYSMTGGGAERVVSILLEELKAHYDITLVLMSKKMDYTISNEIKIHYLENSTPDEHGILKLIKLPYLAWKYKQFSQKNNIDISMSFTTRPTYLSVLSKIFGNKSYIVINESTTPSMMYKSKTLVSKINKFLIKHLYPRADSIVSNSEGGRLDLINNFNINEKKIQTIYNPCDLSLIQKKSQEESSFPLNDIYTFISAGRLDHGKNHTLLIKAFSNLENKNTQLIILGEGYLKDELTLLIAELSLERRVYLLGFDANPYKYFSKANSFIFSSNYEGFPVVLIEALTCALPMISTDCKSGPRELLSPSSDISIQLKDKIEIAEFGILTPVGNEVLLSEGMKRLLEDTKLQDDYRKKSEERVLAFKKENIIPLFLDVLNEGTA